MRFKIPKVLALLAVAPFLLAFSPPEEGGDYLSFSGGHGRSVSMAACSRPRMTEHTDLQAGYYHQWKPLAYGTRLGLGLDGHVIMGREKVCTQEDCANEGWTGKNPKVALSPYGSVDFPWVGLAAGSHLTWNLVTGGDAVGETEKEWVPLPGFGQLRVGPLDRIYGTLEVLNGRPIQSGGFFYYGFGARILGTDVWAGANGLYADSDYSARLSRRVGPVRLRLSGHFLVNDIHYSASDDDVPTEDFRIRVPDYAVSAGVDWRLPF